MSEVLDDWNTSVPDWEKRIVAQVSIIPIVPLNIERADKAERIFKRLRLVDVIGEPTMGEACAPWVFQYVRVIFGAYDPETRRQIIREFFLLVAKKNSKSSLAAAIMVTALILNERRQGEYLILAPTKDVADNSFGPAYGMIQADPALRRRFKPSQTSREIINRVDDSILSVKAADAETVGGQKAISVLVDELWLFGKKASAENVLSEATGSLVSRPEGFVIYLSTQSDEPPTGVFKKKLDYHRDVRDGIVIDRTSMPLIFEYPQSMVKAEAWKDPDTYFIPNPSLGRSVDLTWLKSEFAKKDREGSESRRLFLAKHLNVEIGMNLRANRWVGADHWSKSADKTITLDRILKECEVVIVGLDGGGLADLFGLAVLGRRKEDKKWIHWGHAWCHQSVLTYWQGIATQLQRFSDIGELTIIGNKMDDMAQIVDVIKRVKAAGILGGVAVDPAGIGSLVDEMNKIGINVENKRLIGVSQGIAMMNAIKTTERKLVDGTLVHGDQEIMKWAVGNLKIESMATAIRATKMNAGELKIDPVMALFDAVDAMIDDPKPLREARYQVIVV